MTSKTHGRRVRAARRAHDSTMVAEGLTPGVHADEMEHLRRLHQRVTMPAASRREWEDALVRGAAYFTCSTPITEARPRGQRLQWEVVPLPSLALACHAAQHNPRALVYAVSPAGDSAPLARADWPRYLQLRGET